MLTIKIQFQSSKIPIVIIINVLIYHEMIELDAPTHIFAYPFACILHNIVSAQLEQQCERQMQLWIMKGRYEINMMRSNDNIYIIS